MFLSSYLYCYTVCGFLWTSYVCLTKRLKNIFLKWTCWGIYRVIVKLVVKVVKLELSYWLEKKQNFMIIFLISMIWRSDYWSLHNVLISKSDQNAEKSGIWLFSNYFRDLLSENAHIIHYQLNGLNPNMILSYQWLYFQIIDIRKIIIIVCFFSVQ